MKGFIGVALFAIVAAATAENLCPPEQATEWDTIELLLPHKKCNKFYKCTYGEPVEQDCPAGLYYNDETYQCDWPNLVECGDRVDPAAPVESEEKPEESVEEKPEDSVEEMPEESVEESTEDGGSGDGENEIDVDNGSEDNNTDGDNESAESDSEEGEVEITFLPNGCPENPHVHWLLPNEYDCNAFFYCVWGEKVPRKCSQALDFNPVLQVCDWPANAGCAKSVSKHADQRRYFIDRM